eukprot:4428228-Prymnesium_polylepis.1
MSEHAVRWDVTDPSAISAQRANRPRAQTSGSQSGSEPRTPLRGEPTGPACAAAAQRSARSAFPEGVSLLLLRSARAARRQAMWRGARRRMAERIPGASFGGCARSIVVVCVTS